MAANTKLAPDVATMVANKHRETAASVGSEQKKFNSAVDLMDDACDGAMMKALMDAREAWTQELSAVIADLNEMAGNVDGTVGDFSQQDSENAGGIGKIDMSILKDI